MSLHQERRPASIAEIKYASGQLPPTNNLSTITRLTPQNGQPFLYRRAQPNKSLPTPPASQPSIPENEFLFSKAQDQKWAKYPALQEAQEYIETLHEQISELLVDGRLDTHQGEVLQIQLKEAQKQYNYAGISTTAADIQEFVSTSSLEHNPHHISLAYYMLYRGFLDNEIVLQNLNEQIAYVNECVSQAKSIHNQCMKRLEKQQQKEQEEQNKQKRGKRQHSLYTSREIKDNPVLEDDVETAFTNWKNIIRERDQLLPEKELLEQHLKTFFPLLQTFAALRSSMQLFKNLPQALVPPSEELLKKDILQRIQPLLQSIVIHISEAEEFTPYVPQYSLEELRKKSFAMDTETFKDTVIEPMKNFPYEEFVTYGVRIHALFQEMLNSLQKETGTKHVAFSEEQILLERRIKHLEKVLQTLQQQHKLLVVA